MHLSIKSLISIFCLSLVIPTAYCLDGSDFKSDCKRFFTEKYPESSLVEVGPVELLSSRLVGDVYLGLAVINRGTKSMPGINTGLIFLAQKPQGNLHPKYQIARHFIPMVKGFQQAAANVFQRSTHIRQPNVDHLAPVDNPQKIGAFWYWLDGVGNIPDIYKEMEMELREILDVEQDIIVELGDEASAYNILDLGINKAADFEFFTESEVWEHVQSKYPTKEQLVELLKIKNLMSEKGLQFLQGRLPPIDPDLD